MAPPMIGYSIPRRRCSPVVIMSSAYIVERTVAPKMSDLYNQESDQRTRAMTQHDTNPAYSRVANELRRLILDGELIPGERLPVEADLAERFGVSRSTVREALRSLTTQNLAVTVRGVSGGTFVSRPDPDQVSDSLTTGLGFLTVAEELTVAELMQARELLEVPAASSAARNRTAEQLERILGSLPARPGSDVAPTFLSQHRVRSALLRVQE